MTLETGYSAIRNTIARPLPLTNSKDKIPQSLGLSENAKARVYLQPMGASLHQSRLVQVH